MAKFKVLYHGDVDTEAGGGGAGGMGAARQKWRPDQADTGDTLHAAPHYT